MRSPSCLLFPKQSQIQRDGTRGFGALFVDHDAVVADVLALDGQHHILSVFELHNVRELPVFLRIGDFFDAFTLDVFDAHGQCPSGIGQPKSPLTTVTWSGFRSAGKVGAQIQTPRSPTPARENAQLSIGADHETVLVARGVEGPPKVDGVTPRARGVPLAHPQVVAPT